MKNEPVNCVEHRLQSLKTPIIKLLSTGKIKTANNMMRDQPSAPWSSPHLSLFSWTGKRPPKMTSPGIRAPVGAKLAAKSDQQTTLNLQFYI